MESVLPQYVCRKIRSRTAQRATLDERINASSTLGNSIHLINRGGLSADHSIQFCTCSHISIISVHSHAYALLLLYQCLAFTLSGSRASSFDLWASGCIRRVDERGNLQSRVKLNQSTFTRNAQLASIISNQLWITDHTKLVPV
jgi:hypothetical protein